MKLLIAAITVVQMLTIDSVLCEQVRLSWNPNSEPDLAGYRIYYGLGSRNYSREKDVGNQTTTDLDLGFGRWYFAVTAYDTSDNESGFSSEQMIDVASLVTSVIPPTLAVRPLTFKRKFYTDEDFTVEQIPAIVAGSQLIFNRDADKTDATASAMQFTITRAADVFVGYHSVASATPAWLVGWTNTGEQIITSVGIFQLYQKSYQAGCIKLGGNMQAPAMGAQRNYLVMVKQTASCVCQ